MDFYPLEIAGKTYRLRFTADDVRDICRRLTPLQPPGGVKVTPPVLGQLLVNLDPDTIECCLLYGLRHMAEYKKIDLPDAQKIIGNAIKAGAQYTDFRRPIFRALVACGLADFAPVIKVLDDAEADSGEAEADAGNAPEQYTMEPGTTNTRASRTTRPVTTLSPVGESDSST